MKHFDPALRLALAKWPKHFSSGMRSTGLRIFPPRHAALAIWLDSCHNSSYRLTMTLQLQWRSANCLAAFPIRNRSAGSRTSFSSFSHNSPKSIVVDCANESSSNIELMQSASCRWPTCGGKNDRIRNPVSPSATRSRYPSQSETTAGTPYASASATVKPKVSWMLSLGETKMSAPEYSRCLSSAEGFTHNVRFGRQLS